MPADRRPGARALAVALWVVRALVVLTAIATATACTGTEPAPEVRVVDAFTIPGDTALAVYLVLENGGGADHLVGASLAGDDAALAARITLHATEDRGGLSTMVPAERIRVRADEATALGPGGGHLMLEGLTRPVELGDELALTLVFDRGGPMATTVQVIEADAAMDRIDRAGGS